MTALTAWDGRRESLSWLTETTSALPYQLLGRPRVLVLGAGGGAEVWQALYHDAWEVEAVEINPAMLGLLRASLHDPRVRFHQGDARGFVRSDRGQYDLIQVAPLDSYGGSGAGVQAMAESHLYTVEAIADYYARLAPGGLLALTRWVKEPPREGPRLFATAVAALRVARDRSGRTPGRDPRLADEHAAGQQWRPVRRRHRPPAGILRDARLRPGLVPGNRS